jgi:predicted porin
MKKTLVALAVLTAASSAQAFVVYDQDKITVDLKGDIEVQYASSFAHSSMKQEIEDADFGFDVRYMINDEWTVGGYWEFNGSTDTNATNAEAGDTFVAAYSKSYGSLKVGRLCTAIDDAGTGSDEVFGLKSFFSNTSPCEDEAIRYDYDNGQFYTTLGFVQDKHETHDLTGDSNYFDARLGARFGEGFDASVFVASGEVNKANDAATEVLVTDDSLLGLELVFTGIENVKLEAGYYTTEQEVNTVTASALGYTVGDKEESDTIAVAAGYKMGLYGINAGYSTTDRTNNVDASVVDQSNYFINATYSVAPTAKLYIEVGGQDKDGQDNDTALAIGAEASF